MSPEPIEISLQTATPEDLDLLFRVYASTRQEEMQQWGWPPMQQEAFLRMQFNARRGGYRATYPDATESILRAAGTPVGSIVINRSASEIRLVDISILTEHRQRGIGAYLISNLIHEAAQAKLPLRLSVIRSNRAQRLYQRLGFSICGSDDMYHEMEYNRY